MKKIPLEPEDRDKQKKIRKKVAGGDSLEPLMSKQDQDSPRLKIIPRTMGLFCPPKFFKPWSDRPENIHVVQDSDTLSSIASEYGTTVEELKKLNNLTDEQAGQLKTGQKIRYK